MGEVLYRKYRSKSLDEIVGQEHITTTLQRALEQDKISHAYLFTGPRGVGKTSIARILAYAINDLDYQKDSKHHLDIIEIDAASNRRIDEIRELRDKVHVAPTSAKYKVYIIDEVHMLTREAFNALLKTLEEPPEHVVFILATTEAHKLPETIISRTQRFSFKPITQDSATKYLGELAKKEGIAINDEALQLIAEHGAGSFRDSISLLDQLSNTGESTITADTVRMMIGVPPREAIIKLEQALHSHQADNVQNTIEELYQQGYQAPQIAKQLLGLLREGKWSQKEFNSKILALLPKLINVPGSSDPQVYLELILLETVIEPAIPSITPTAKPAPPKEKASIIEGIAPDPEPSPEPELTPAPDKPAAVATKQPPAPKDSSDMWPQTLEALKGQYNTLYGIARMAQATFDGKTLHLHFAFAFHQRRCNESRNRQRIAEVAQKITGQPVTIECVLTKEAKPDKEPLTVKPQPSATLESITEVFGGGEVLD